jgi:glycosyltransferase involved in cell wall biosynthesis
LDGSSLRREYLIPPEAFVVGHVARMTPWKGQHLLLEAFAKIAATRPDAYLVFVGAPVFDNDSFERKLRQQAVRMGLQERVKFTGYRHDLPEVLAAMDVFAFTSIEKDTSPLALLSAMSSGLPIVAFDIEGVREIAKTDEPFLLVPVGDAGSLAHALTRLLSSRELCQRRKAESEFSLNVYASRIIEVLAGALSAEGKFPVVASAYSRVSNIGLS